MKLSQLTLSNFKGAREFTLAAHGADVSVYGDNATGKTTIADAFYWCLFGKDSAGRSNFGVRTLDREGKSLPVDSTVEIVFGIDGEETSLRRTYREENSTVRGKLSDVSRSNTTDYFINAVPKKEKDFDAEVSTICKPALFRLLTDPLHFSTAMKWEERRKVLLDVCGNYSDADVIASNNKLAEIPSFLGKKSIDDYREIAKASRKEAADEVSRIPVRIDELSRSKPTNVSSEKVDERIANLRASIQDLQNRKAQVGAGGEVAKRQVELSRVDVRMGEIISRLRLSASQDRESALSRVRSKESEIADQERSLRSIDSQVRPLEGEKTRLAGQIDTKRTQWRTINAEEFTGVLTGADACPSCGQPLPADKVQAAIEAFNLQREQFNERKAGRLTENQAEGRAMTQRVKTIDEQLESLANEAICVRGRIGTLTAEKTAILIPEVGEFDPLADTEYSQLLDKKGAIETEIAELRQNSQSAIASLDGEIANVQAEISAAEEIAAAQRLAASTEARLKELGDREKDLNKQLEKLDKELFLLEEFIRTKVRLLTERINSRFQITRFKLFEEQMNGGLKECCEPMAEGPDGQLVPYKDLNHGAQVNVGLDIINALAEHHGFAPPVFIDNAESVTTLISTLGQQIRLIVSAADKALRVETTQFSLKEAA